MRYMGDKMVNCCFSNLVCDHATFMFDLQSCHTFCVTRLACSSHSEHERVTRSFVQIHQDAVTSFCASRNTILVRRLTFKVPSPQSFETKTKAKSQRC